MELQLTALHLIHIVESFQLGTESSSQEVKVKVFGESFWQEQSPGALSLARLRLVDHLGWTCPALFTK